MSSWWDRFKQRWAKDGVVNDPTLAQANAGWNYIGQAPPTVEQFNSVMQWWDDKDNWLYGQIDEVIKNAGMTSTETPVTTLRDALLLKYQIKLTYTPVEQGGGSGQGTNKVRMGWATNGVGVKVQIDGNDMGYIAFLGRTQSWTAAQNFQNGITSTTISASGNIGTSQSVTATLDVTANRNIWVGNNIRSAFDVNADRDLVAARNVTATYVYSSGNITAAGTISGGVVSSTGNVTGAYLYSSGSIYAAGNIDAAGSITAASNVNGNNFLGRGSTAAIVPSYDNRPQYCLFGNAAGAYIQFQNYWHWLWNTTNGDLIYYGDAGGYPTERLKITASGNLVADQSLKFRGSSGAEFYGTPGGVAVMYYSDGSGTGFQQTAIKGYTTPYGIFSHTYWYGGGCWNVDDGGNSAQQGQCAATAFPIISDATLKQNIKSWTPGLTEILKIETVSFEFKEKIKQGRTHYGATAQQMKDALPEAVVEIKRDLTSPPLIPGEEYKHDVNDYMETHLGIDPSVVLYAMVNAIKTLSNRLDALEK